MGLLKKYRILLLLLTTVLLNSCGKKSSCIKNTGKKATEIRSISGEINKIEIKDNINLVLVQDSLAIVKIEGGENLLPYVKIDVNNNTISISNGNKCNFLRSYKEPITVYLSVTDIREINYTGKGSVSNTGTLNFNDFTIDVKNGTGNVNLTLNSDKVAILSHTGATDFTLNGFTKDLYVYTGSNSWFYLMGTVATNVHVNTAGTGDVFVAPINTLLVELTSLGNVRYKGNPNITMSTHTGSGQIIKQ
ncbi:MAG: DUF2807 domain-containing protein [Vicingus serpentipes]|nr:DUF2807 domain-containing protein [Vicingus serpentipes]